MSLTAIGVGMAALAVIGGGLGIGFATSSAVKAIAQQPEAHGKIRTAVLQSQQDFVIMRCQSSHAAVPDGRAWPVRPATCCSFFRGVLGPPQWTIRSRYRWYRSSAGRLWCCPKSCGIFGHNLH